jgi:hypothetical protein
MFDVRFLGLNNTKKVNMVLSFLNVEFKEFIVFTFPIEASYSSRNQIFVTISAN